jgi:hypothetical protein
VRVGLLADTHDRVPAVDELLRRFSAAGVSLVLHAGDVCAPFTLAPLRDHALPLLGVFGRNDGDREGLVAAASALPAGGELHEAPHSLELEGTSLLLVHSLAGARERSIDAHQVVVHGSTHLAEQRTRGATLLVNPGEACGWLHGTPTGAILDLATRHVEFLTLSGPEWSR